MAWFLTGGVARLVLCSCLVFSVADPDLELRGEGGAVLTYFPSDVSSFFTQNKGGGGGLDPPLILRFKTLLYC